MQQSPGGGWLDQVFADDGSLDRDGLTLCWIYIEKGNLWGHCLLKGWLTAFFIGLIVFMGCSLTCVNASFLKKHIFHLIYLYSTPLCPFSYERSDDFLVL